MGLLSLPAPRLTILSSSSLPSSSSSSSRNFVIDRHSFLSGQVISVSSSKRFSDARNFKFIGFKTKALESARASSRSSQVTKEATKQESQLKDKDLVFVAGATGRVGFRTVRELLKLGFRVRAGVRSSSRAGALLQSVQQKKLDDGATVVEKLEIVECDLERDSIAPAIGNASVVICCIGASEKEVFDITGPYRIDYKATKNLIDAATVAGVNHFILLTSLGTNKIGFPAAILNFPSRKKVGFVSSLHACVPVRFDTGTEGIVDSLFWGVLIWKRKAEEALIESGLPYTIVRPGGMERPTDAYKETHNIVLTKEDTLFGGQVSNLQVAELLAFMARNRGLSHCKVVEVIAETTAPLTSMGELLATIPSQRLDLTQPEEPQSVDKLDPLPSEKINFEAKSSLVKEKPVEKEVEITTPLSPYVAYYDLKPPASPTPTPPRSTKEHASVVQPGLKVATQVDISIPTTVVADEKSVPVEALGSMPLSPYPVYDDLKPPSSPSPSPPNAGPAPSIFASGVESESSATTGTINSVAKPITSDKQHSGELKPSPLSPFTMYYDLKPPSSPMPSSPSKC